MLYEVITVSCDTLPLVDRTKLGADLVKLMWSPELADAAAVETHPIHAALARTGRKRAVLARIDTAEQIRVGQDLGLSMFQGRGVERMIQAQGQRRGSERTMP